MGDDQRGGLGCREDVLELELRLQGVKMRIEKKSQRPRIIFQP
jgi:hypothetical protein